MRNFLLAIMLLISGGIFSQNGSSYSKNPKHQVYNDSLRAHEYKGTLPFLGKQTYKKGFDIPYPVGVMGNVMWLEQGLFFSNFKLGVKSENVDIPATPVDFLQFGDVRTKALSTTFRPDIWILPFLNVYGIFGVAQSETNVSIIAPIEFTSIVNQTSFTSGFGVMGAGGIGPLFFSVDANFTWNKPKLLDKPVAVNVLGLRIGHSFKFQARPDRNIALWVGSMRVSMNSGTVGEIQLREAISDDFWNNKDMKVAEYWDWYNALDPSKPLDAKKIAIADDVLTPIITEIDSKNGEATIRYEMDKEVKQKWNFIVGGQFQINKHWQVRAEGGMLGDRKSFLASLNYRFIL